MGSAIRCFIAIKMSREITETLGNIQEELKRGLNGVNPVRSKTPKASVMPIKRTSNGVKWVNPENIHLTLKFIGYLEKEPVERVKLIMERIASQVSTFKIRLSSAGAFPTPEQPRVIWIGIDEGSEEFSRLAGLIDEELVNLGIEKENRPFHPHLTLARVKFLKGRFSVKNAFSSLKIPQCQMTAEKITLFQSVLARQGSIYSVLHELNLKKSW